MVERGKPEEMTVTRALALGAVACDHVHEEEAPDIREWQDAAAVLRELLAEVRGQSVGSWFFSYSKPPAKPRRKKNRNK